MADAPACRTGHRDQVTYCHPTDPSEQKGEHHRFARRIHRLNGLDDRLIGRGATIDRAPVGLGNLKCGLTVNARHLPGHIL
eukprot:CAMPEP_0184406940 /NCGR_PEP_ID=MMETSP0738-20130409/2018_1 /TAXON_ID=385413 /ORGANISM="Thalassiosira miniscula, Strain CCMP1093" /LENGTH=80 /DNA_ID=CAMNT_0026763973 /DNA_START=88 /DNA_END=327 /DNA_ORIENTATION=+